ncbi:FAD-binding and (Fe-S)-binding domain-containing protein [Corynebacterium pacaense]|uniref:FAD-binding and (Fe-S)-binding domain-containing protein n=1 Tax=Corynebacterium pacaense TaxID=1816684 RepID=UPI0009B9C2E5|nr:FAD-binding and (Fe-S)-binding domain-containing protein [Corynebacterium pacaense]
MTRSRSFDHPGTPVWAAQARAGLRTDMGTRAAYSSDAGIFRRVPAAVAEPSSVAEVRDAIAVAVARGWPIVGRGGGSSVAGNAIGEGLIIDTSRHLNRILEIDPRSRTAVVEPGVVCDALRDAAAEFGLTYGPDPSTHSRCTIGGMVSNNACGSHSIAYGTAAQNLVDITVMLADGREVTITARGCDDQVIDEALKGLARHRRLIDAHLGRFPRQVSGYGLQYLATDVAKAMAGTEGTTGIITRLRVNLVEVPKFTALAVLAFDTIFDAAEAAPELRLPGVATIEGMGGDLLAALRSRKGRERDGSQLPGGDRAGGWLYCETGGDTHVEAVEAALGLAEGVDTLGHLVVSDPAEMRELWRIRESAAGTATRLPEGGEAWPNWEDSAVPPENLAAYLRDLYALMDRYDYRGIPFGHFGEGCVHVRISFDFTTPEGVSTFEAFMGEAATLASSHGGSLSGEHGDGRARSALLDRMYPPEILELFEEFKLIFDPDRIFNPGVLVWADPLTRGLRMDQGQRHLDITPVHRFSADRGSMINAVNRCVGVSACRSGENAMCPSFQITGDEVHSTRGRARVLSEMFRGESITGGFRNEEVAQALDLCLSCRACASECPVNVDMATYKAEFLDLHYRGRIRPMAHYVMGWLPLLGHLVHRIPLLPRIIDAAMGSRRISPVIRRVGGLADRPLIRFAHHRLERPEPRAGDTVVLWPDSFTSTLDTARAEAAIRVLEALGFSVEIPRGFVCCGLTWHSTGQLGMTRRVLEHTASVMKPHLDRGLTIVGLEPSCTAMLSGEIRELSDNPELHRLSELTRSFAEVVAPRLRSLNLPATGVSALTQIHCHERATGDPGPSRLLLDALGVAAEEITTGCCGLAGNWGFEKGHAEMSFALGERELFPRVRAAEGYVIADGFSCRTQIEQGTGRRALHLAEVVLEILRSNGVAE